MSKLVKKSKLKKYDLPVDIKEKVPWFRRRIRAWFKENRRIFPWRAPGLNPYEVLVAEIMLQRTVAANVVNVYSSFLEKYPTFSTLSRATIEELEEILKPLGLWRLKARVFQQIARVISENNNQLPSSREELERLENVGQYTASVILTTFHGMAEPFIDVNIARVIDRFFGPRVNIDIRNDPYLKSLSGLIVKNARESLELNWAILDFAALICKAPKPLCTICPVKEKCLYFKKHGGFHPEQS